MLLDTRPTIWRGQFHPQECVQFCFCVFFRQPLGLDNYAQGLVCQYHATMSCSWVCMWLVSTWVWGTGMKLENFSMLGINRSSPSKCESLLLFCCLVQH